MDKNQNVMSLNLEELEAQEVYIFGAGLAGQSAYEKLKSKMRVKGFIDNNARIVKGLPSELAVQTPEQWATGKESYDFILVASEHFESITQQLMQEFGVTRERIVILPARLIKPVNLGQSTLVNDNAYQILFLLTRVLEHHNVNYHVDAGTLLGIYRDGKLIPWDDDLDIAVSAADMEDIKNVLGQIAAELSRHFVTQWTVDVHYASRAFGAVPEGAIRGFKIKTTQDEENLPMVDVFVKYINGDHMDYTLSSRGIRMPSQHLLHTENTTFQNRSIRFPKDVEGYLTAHYGDWRTPVKDWNLSMLKNSTVY